MENRENQLLDYQEFKDVLVDQEYIPSKVDYQWVDRNEHFMRETLFAFYTIYMKKRDHSLLHPLLRLYADVILAAHSQFPEEEGYL